MGHIICCLWAYVPDEDCLVMAEMFYRCVDACRTSQHLKSISPPCCNTPHITRQVHRTKSVYPTILGKSCLVCVWIFQQLSNAFENIITPVVSDDVAINVKADGEHMKDRLLLACILLTSVCPSKSRIWVPTALLREMLNLLRAPRLGTLTVTLETDMFIWLQVRYMLTCLAWGLGTFRIHTNVNWICKIRFLCYNILHYALNDKDFLEYDHLSFNGQIRICTQTNW
jgi:hypothetical protein